MMQPTPMILLIDFETTGLKPGFHDPIQVAALLVSPDLQELDAFESLIRPANPQNATPEAMQVHKKPMSKLMAAPSAYEVMTQLKAFADRAGVAYISGFNVDFDLKFLDALEQATGIRIARQAGPILCGRQIYLKANGLGLYTRGTKLGDLCTKYGIATDGAHDALADVRMTLKLLQALRQNHPEPFAFLGPVEEPMSSPATTILEDQVADLLTKIREADEAVASAKAIAKATPEGQALEVALAQAAGLRAELQTLLEEAEGVVVTPAGKAGFQERRSITFRPTDVRDLAGPAIAMLCIKETVDEKALKAHVQAGIKAETLAPDLMDQLKARADVKVTKAYICQPQAPAAVTEEAAAQTQEAFAF